MMEAILWDAHTHHPAEAKPNLRQIQSLRPEEALATAPTSPHVYRSVGLHPWHQEDLTERGLASLDIALRQPQVIALGEAGLDKVCDAPLAQQIHFFCEQISLAEDRELPVFIHLVRAQDELVRLKKELRPHQPWIIHGFRGKGTQAEQLLRQGFYLSFGAQAHIDTLSSAWRVGRLLLETDDRPVPNISEVYEKTASALGISRQRLSEGIASTVKCLFPLL